MAGTTLHDDGKPTAYDQMKHVILDKLSKDKERSIEEVTGCRKVLSTVYMQAEELFPLTATVIRGLHHDLLRYHPESALTVLNCFKSSPEKRLKVAFVVEETGLPRRTV